MGKFELFRTRLSRQFSPMGLRMESRAKVTKIKFLGHDLKSCEKKQREIIFIRNKLRIYLLELSTRLLIKF